MLRKSERIMERVNASGVDFRSVNKLAHRIGMRCWRQRKKRDSTTSWECVSHPLASEVSLPPSPSLSLSLSYCSSSPAFIQYRFTLSLIEYYAGIPCASDSDCHALAFTDSVCDMRTLVCTLPSLYLVEDAYLHCYIAAMSTYTEYYIRYTVLSSPLLQYSRQ